MLRWRRVTRSNVFWAVVLLVGLLIANLVVTPSFFNIDVIDGALTGSLINILRNGARLIIIALGMTLVIATRGIDLSVGAVAAVAGAVSCVYISSSPNPGSAGTAMTAIAMALGLALLMGLWNGFLVSVIGIQPIIATLVLMTAGRGLAMLITGGSANVSILGNPTFKLIGGGSWLGLPFAFVIAGVVLLVIGAFTRRSALGMLIESVGINPEASRLAGVRSVPIVWLVYVVCALCAGIAGVMISSNVSAADPNNDGLFIEMDAILAVVIGGTALSGGKFSLSGTVVGALIIQTLTITVYTMGIAPEITLVFKAAVVVVICLLQSSLVRSAFARRRARPVAPAVRQEAAR